MEGGKDASLERLQWSWQVLKKMLATACIAI